MVAAAAGLAISGCGLSRGQTAHAADGAQEDGLNVVCGGATTVPGIDVSEYDNETTGTARPIDWRAVADGGLVFAIARVGDGLYVDPWFASNWAGIADAGIIRGAYQFFEANDDIASEAQVVVDQVGMLGPTDLPVTADIERAPNGFIPTAQQLSQWMAIVEKGTGKLPMIYCGASYWNSTFGGLSTFNGNPLWVANWQVSCPDLPANWSAWTIWQYNDVGVVTGLPQGDKSDVDVFNGSRDDLLTFAASSSVTCHAIQTSCSIDSDCCFGLTCQNGSCQTAPTACGALNGSCTRAADCCSGLSCETWTPSGGTPGLHCCDAQGATCSTGRDCCGGMLCTGGTCACVPQAAFCQNDSDCCSGLSCQSKKCETAPSCGAIQSLCAANADCCSGLICQVRSPAGGSPSDYCCKGVTAACTAGTECCGGMNCTGGVCACVALGQYCENDADCCSGNVCQNQSCVAPGATTTTTTTTGTSAAATSSAASSTSASSASSSSSSTGSTAATSSTGTSMAATASSATGASGTTGGASTSAATTASSAGATAGATSGGQSRSTAASTSGPTTAAASTGTSSSSAATSSSSKGSSSKGAKASAAAAAATSSGGSTPQKSGCGSTEPFELLWSAWVAVGALIVNRRRFYNRG